MKNESNSHICYDGCTHESHQYLETPIVKPSQLDDYHSDIKDLGLNMMSRRNFLKSSTATLGMLMLMSGGALSLLAACGNDELNKNVINTDLEKPELTIGFIPITCATPIIMADPMGFYKKYGLNVTVKKYAGWADIRDAFIAGEIDAAHLLSPMTLALSMGIGSSAVPTRLAAIENINGQAITLANKHKGKVKDIKDLKGMTLGIPFEYSMHNLLLRYYLAEGGLNPDIDVNIRVTRPADMVANLASGNIDGFLGPEPFNQRAVFQEFGFIFKLTKDLWTNHPCCAFGVKQDFIDKNPKTYNALLKSITDATYYSSDNTNREKIAKAISTKQYLNQPEEAVKQVLTGKGPDGTGNIINDPKRIDFDPFPYKSFGAWMLTQFSRWDYVKEPLDTEEIKKIVDEVFLTNDLRQIQKELGHSIPENDYKVETIMGKAFDIDNLWMTN
ncbi:ABC transporter substrate-binding protein [Bacillus benzoevorans]|nr:ABC transporter substrate-binding protein [Bacillus benzoevorans]